MPAAAAAAERACMQQPQPNLALAVAAALLLLLAAAAPAAASEGDASPLFRSCHAACLATGCTKTPGPANTCDTACPATAATFAPPLALRLMRWDCGADCAYHCMWAIEGPKAAGRTGPVFKYFGKWPFVRLLGMQEAASVLFSLANLAAHLHCLARYRRAWLLRGSSSAPKAAPPKVAGGGGSNLGGNLGGSTGASAGAAAAAAAAGAYPFHWMWLCYAAAHANAWLWSAMFHCRDTRPTERADYFSADAAVAAGLGALAVRALGLTSRLRLMLLGLVLGAGLGHHIRYMAAVKFDYGYNMALCIGVGVATAAGWLAWVTAVRHPGRGLLYQFMGLLHGAMLLEVLDFPPLGWVLDAHASWHAATVPLTYLWYRFVHADVAWVVAGGGGGGQSGVAAAAAHASRESGGGGGGGHHHELGAAAGFLKSK